MQVMLSHYKGWSKLAHHGLVHAAMAVGGQGALGVSTFFVMSGFLITTLLLNEMERSGRIELSRFYLRRSLRIVPPFFLFLVVAVLVGSLQGHPVPRLAWLSSALFCTNYVPYLYTHPLTSGWYVSHTWSLSVEEQFYLLWPMALILLTRRRMLQVCSAVLLAGPLLRLLSAYLFPVYRMDAQYLRLFHGTADVLVVGCVAAFWIRDPERRRRMEAIFTPPVFLIACGYLTISTVLRDHLPIWYECLIGVDLTVFSLAVLLLFVLLHPEARVARLLQAPPLRHIGRISYSLFLWQQLFLSPYRAPSRVVSIVLAFACAEASYWLVERPSLRWRSRLTAELWGSRAERETAERRDRAEVLQVEGASQFRTAPR